MGWGGVGCGGEGVKRSRRAGGLEVVVGSGGRGGRGGGGREGGRVGREGGRVGREGGRVGRENTTKYNRFCKVMLYKNKI